MENKTLLHVSLLSAVVGLVIIFIASENVQLKPTDILSITQDHIGKNVKVCGKVDSLRITKDLHVFLEILDDGGNIDIVAFNSNAEKLGAINLKDGEPICVSGKVSEYGGSLEIIAKEITKE